MIATAFLGTTLQARIDSTQDVNKDSYLKAVADRIVTGSGDPADWGARGLLPSDLGLATKSSVGTYELDIDKISRLSNQNSNALSYPELANAAKLNNIAVGITVSQILSMKLVKTNNYTIGEETYITLTISTTIESKPTLANLHCYIIADNYQYNSTASTTESGTYALTVHFPTVNANDALLVVFARALFDERITSYATCSLADSVQETIPAKTSLALSPLNNTLSYNGSLGASLEKVYILSYSYEQAINTQGSSCTIPKLIDHSPYVLVACGQKGTQPLEEWTSYPQVPLTAGSSFANSERNVFPYTVTIEGLLYKLEITLGDLNP